MGQSWFGTVECVTSRDFLVPTIDLAPWWSGERIDQTAVAHAFDRAASTVAFYAAERHRMFAENIWPATPTLLRSAWLPTSPKPGEWRSP